MRQAAVASWESVVRTRTDLSVEAIGHLRALTREWALLADLGFSDLVLFVRTWDAAGWIAVAHVRPSTAPTVLLDDPVGAFLPRSRATLLERALQSGERVRTRPGRDRTADGRPVLWDPLEVIPVRDGGDIIAGISRFSSIDQRRTGELEQQYLRACDELLLMVSRDDFPVQPSESVGAASPRVGDGMIRLDPGARVVYASPNARTCLRIMGVADPVVGANLADELARVGGRLAPVDQSAMRIARAELAGDAEFVSASAVATVRAIPIRTPAPAGGIVLIRDVTEVRRQERALLSKDATIREIHHRVKNNLQTVGALLRLQARRMPAAASRAALLDAVARVGTIALVHDSLAQSPGESVDFDEICTRILAIAMDAAAAQEAETVTQTRISGSFGVLPSTLATPLAMCLSEVLLNAMEHSLATTVWVHAERNDQLVLTVADNGVGFSPVLADGLGLQIVATLVADQLHGTLQIVSTGTTPLAWEQSVEFNESLEQAGIGPATTVIRMRCALA
jgi:two-component system, sensor histidine kinase PdtaS